MTKKLSLLTFIFLTQLSSQQAAAQTDSQIEEAAILNQEMKFLEDSTRTIDTTSLAGSTLPVRNRKSEETGTLEERYFGQDNDSINTRTAAPQRKRSH